jgi:hypothetical protein
MGRAVHPPAGMRIGFPGKLARKMGRPEDFRVDAIGHDAYRISPLGVSRKLVAPRNDG